MNQLSMLFGVLSYEFRMQIRRRAVWITYICIALVLGRVGIFGELLNDTHRVSLLARVVIWTNNVQSIFPIAVGVLLADRLSRDRRLLVTELFTTMPAALGIRLAGKYLGSMLATLLPMFLFYSIGIGFLLYHTQNLMVLPFALVAFAAIVLPGILFVSAFSIACPVILWVPLYQFLFVGYWFWGNLLPPSLGIPTLSDTLLTPIGGYMSEGFFGGGETRAITNASMLQGVESMMLLMSIAILVMIVLWGYLKLEQARQ